VADDKEIRAQIYEFLDAAFVSKDGQPVPFRPNTRTVNDVLDALKAQILISGDLHAPAWLVEGSNPAATEVLPCRNGLLCLSTGELLRHTPDFLGMNALDFDYEPEVMAAHWE
jgi:putative DNA primase/helicase